MPERILMIEDDTHLAAMVEEYLGDRGFSVTACPTAAEGIRQLRQEAFQALILDIMLPETSMALKCAVRSEPRPLCPSSC